MQAQPLASSIATPPVFSSAAFAFRVVFATSSPFPWGSLWHSRVFCAVRTSSERCQTGCIAQEESARGAKEGCVLWCRRNGLQSRMHNPVRVSDCRMNWGWFVVTDREGWRRQDRGEAGE